MRYEEKVRELKKKMNRYAAADVAVAFSGGADSSLLLKLAAEAARNRGRDVYAILMHSMLHPSGEVEEAEAVAEEAGAVFLVLEADELGEAGISDNPKDRCYRCKKYLFQRLMQEGKRLGVSAVLEGTNGDDLRAYRPGLRAVRELGIFSPLAEAGLTKEEVRRLAAELGVSVARKPSAPCLATRFPYGTRLSYQEMRKVEQGEAFIRKLGFYNVRLRIHGDIVRLEVDPEELGLAVKRKEEIVDCLKELGYDYVTLDLEGFRSGSMDIHVKKNPAAQDSP